VWKVSAFEGFSRTVLGRRLRQLTRPFVGNLEGLQSARLVEINETANCTGRLAKVVEFLGYSFSYEADLYGSGTKYWNIQPSQQALAREREKLRQITGSNQCGKAARPVC
jgi:hypothetical protein